jgi:hypothetical protein
VSDAVADYERRFRRAGLPLLIEDYTAAGDVFNRAAPFFALVFLLQAVGATSLSWPWWANVLAALGGLVILLVALAAVNTHRGRPKTAVPERVGTVELALFVVVPGLLPMIFGGQFASGLVTMAVNVALIWLVYLVVGYALPQILRGAFESLVGELALSLASLARAIPLLLLFAAVLFINTEMWQVFSDVPEPFLVLLAVLFIAFGTLFLVVRLPGEVARMEAEADPEDAVPPLNRRQRVNVGLIVLISHALQVAVVTLGVFVAFVGFGALAVGPAVRESWIGTGGNVLVTLTLFDEPIQITEELLRVAGGVAGLSGLYYAIAVLTDATYRDQFMDRMSSGMRQTFVARAEYLRLRAQQSG